MNSYENPSLSYECDLTAERDRLREINKELLAALIKILGEFKERECSNPACRVCARTIACADAARAAIARAKGAA